MLAIVTTMSLVVLHATLDGDAAAPSAPEAAPARVADGRGGAEPAPPPKRGGALRVLTYNVAGLPDFVSDSTPSVNHALISPLLNDFDLAVVQEAFHYHRRLASQAHHPFVIEADPDPWPIFEGDGLAFFSSRPLSEPLRETWEACNGTFSQYSDCLASKGVTRTELHLGPEVAVDVYNLHMDAGEGEGDVAARGAQIEQLLRLIARRSEGRAVIVAGDTNLDVAQPDDRRHLQHLIDAAGLADGCWATRCDDEHIDRILFRGGEDVDLGISRWWIPEGFVDGEGVALSDHDPVAVELWWEVAQPRDAVAEAIEGELGAALPADVDDEAAREHRALMDAARGRLSGAATTIERFHRELMVDIGRRLPGVGVGGSSPLILLMRSSVGELSLWRPASLQELEWTRVDLRP